MLPKEFSPWKTVYDHDSQWNRRGVWETMSDELNRQHRKKTVNIQHRVMALSIRKAWKPVGRVMTAGLMVVRKSNGANGISWWIRWVI